MSNRQAFITSLLFISLSTAIIASLLALRFFNNAISQQPNIDGLGGLGIVFVMINSLLIWSLYLTIASSLTIFAFLHIKSRRNSKKAIENIKMVLAASILSPILTFVLTVIFFQIAALIY